MAPLCLLLVGVLFGQGKVTALLLEPEHHLHPASPPQPGEHVHPSPPGVGPEHVHPSQTPVEIFNENVRKEVNHLYTSFDLNHDGLFTKDDLPLFIHDYDTDGNGTIEQQEYVTHFDVQEPTLALVAGDMFLEFDTDNSGEIGITDMRALYDRMDLNSDGSVDHKEFEDYMTEVMTILAILHLQGHDFD